MTAMTPKRRILAVRAAPTLCQHILRSQPTSSAVKAPCQGPSAEGALPLPQRKGITNGATTPLPVTPYARASPMATRPLGRLQRARGDCRHQRCHPCLHPSATVFDDSLTPPPRTPSLALLFRRAEAEMGWRPFSVSPLLPFLPSFPLLPRSLAASSASCFRVLLTKRRTVLSSLSLSFFLLSSSASSLCVQSRLQVRCLFRESPPSVWPTAPEDGERVGLLSAVFLSPSPCVRRSRTRTARNGERPNGVRPRRTHHTAERDTPGP